MAAKSKRTIEKTKIPTIEPTLDDELHFKSPIKHLNSENQSIFHINRIEAFREKLVLPLPPHRKVVHDLIFITKGNSSRTKGLNTFSFGKNQFFFLPARQITAHESMDEDLEGFFVHFSPTISANFYRSLNKFPFLKFSEEPIVTIPDAEVPAILNILERLMELYSNFKKQDMELVTCYLLALLTEANRYTEQDEKRIKKDKATTLTEEYKNLLAKHIYEKQTVQEYADMLFVTPNHLNKCVKKIINKTAQNILNDMLILEAKSLLKYSKFSISEIAEHLCHQMPSNFSRFFKKQTGMTPRQYLEG